MAGGHSGLAGPHAAGQQVPRAADWVATQPDGVRGRQTTPPGKMQNTEKRQRVLSQSVDFEAGAWKLVVDLCVCLCFTGCSQG